jgi:hypothetical protein
MKGVAWFIFVIFLMLGLSIIVAFFGFQKKVVIEKRAYQEKILSLGNKIEATGNIIIQTTDLATIQALYDIGHSNIAIDNNLMYNDAEKLPYWSDEYEDYIKQATLKLAEKYFENYNKSITDYFMNPETSKERYRYWYVEWEKDMKIEEFNENYISLSFGQFNITYDDSQVKISKKYPLISKIKTSFFKTIERSKEVETMVKSNAADLIYSENPYNILRNIEISLSDKDVSVSLSDKGDYITVFLKENSVRKFYSFSSQKQDYDSLGVKFVLNKKSKCLCQTEDCSSVCWWGADRSGAYECPSSSCGDFGVNIRDMADIKKCNGFYILSNKDHPCDILN